MAGNTWMDRHFHLRSDVQCLDGRAGTLRGLAPDGPSLIVTHLIVQRTPREQDDVAIPVDRVIVPLGDAHGVTIRATTDGRHRAGAVSTR